MPEKLLSGRNVLITGAGGAIGKSIAIEMAKEGARVYFTDIDPSACRELERRLNENRLPFRGFQSDITRSSDIDTLLATLSKERIAIDVLVNNVGIDVESSVKNLELDVWRRVYETNILGPLDLTRKISQMMISRQIKGSIIFITSIHQWTIRRRAAYSSSKAALGMVIKELAVELAPYRIRVNGIAPGYVREDKDGNPLPHRYAPLYSTSINPCFIGRGVVYLASDFFSRFTTGTVVKIDAGLSLYNHFIDEIPPT